MPLSSFKYRRTTRARRSPNEIEAPALPTVVSSRMENYELAMVEKLVKKVSQLAQHDLHNRDYEH